MFTEPIHKRLTQSIIDGEADPSAGDLPERFRAGRRGVFLFYPVSHREHGPLEEPPTMGLALLFPKNDISAEIVFGVADPNRPDDPIVDVP